MSTLEQEIHSQRDSTARAEYVPSGFIQFKKIRLNVKRFRIMWFAYKMLKKRGAKKFLLLEDLEL